MGPRDSFEDFKNVDCERFLNEGNSETPQIASVNESNEVLTNESEHKQVGKLSEVKVAKKKLAPNQRRQQFIKQAVKTLNLDQVKEDADELESDSSVRSITKD